MDSWAVSMDYCAIMCNITSMQKMQMEKNISVSLNETALTGLDDFSACFGARIVYCGTDMKFVKMGQNRSLCEYCSLVRKLYGDERCFRLDTKKLREANVRRRLVHYTCHGGLVEAICPVFLNDLYAGFVMTGQFRTAENPPQSILDDWKRKFKDAGNLLRAYDAVPRIENSKLRSMLGLFSVLVKMIELGGIIKLKGDVIVEKIIYELRSRPDKPMSIAEAARIVGRSRSSICHTFKAKLGKSFNDCVTDIRLERAEEILKKEPGITVKEVASRVGYEDQFYFSRVFSRRKGVTPSKLIQKKDFGNMAPAIAKITVAESVSSGADKRRG